MPARSSLPRLLPQIELPRFPDQCLSEFVVLFRGDELESGALVGAAGRRWENDQKLQSPSPLDAAAGDIAPEACPVVPHPGPLGSHVVRMIQPHSTRHPAASSVPRWLTICLQRLLFQQMHYHGSESRVMPLRGIELFLSTREDPLRMINSYLSMGFCRPTDQNAQRISLQGFQER